MRQSLHYAAAAFMLSIAQLADKGGYVIGFVSPVAMPLKSTASSSLTNSIISSSATSVEVTAIGSSASRRLHMITNDGDDMASTSLTSSRREFLGGGVATTAALAVAGVLGSTPEPAAAVQPVCWKQVELPIATTLYDITFDTNDPQHGWCVGARGTFLETKDGGDTWIPRTFGNLDADDEINYRFQKISCMDGEVFVVGKPPILLHSADAGKSWERVSLSPKLPGEPASIVALGNQKAEMTTSTGAIYYTTNAGQNWKAQVKETIDATLNRISSSGVQGASYFSGSIIGTTRDASGAYIAVSSRGNFYLTWTPGSEFWIPHNRGTSRRIQNMGFVKNDIKNGLWMTLNGGDMQTTQPNFDFSSGEPEFSDVRIRSGGYGIIDVTYRNDNEAWAVGGGGNLWVSTDGGKTFFYNKSADRIAGNLYDVKFFGEDKGFVLGSDGVLLKYIPGQLKDV